MPRRPGELRQFFGAFSQMPGASRRHSGGLRQFLGHSAPGSLPVTLFPKKAGPSVHCLDDAGENASAPSGRSPNIHRKLNGIGAKREFVGGEEESGSDDLLRFAEAAQDVIVGP
jgi:hypothetical protein